MDLRQEWQKLHQEKFNYSPINKEQIMKAIYQESTSTIATLKKRLKGKIYWILFFLVMGVIWMLFSLNRPELLLIQGFFISTYFLSFIVLGLQYRMMDANLDYTDQTLPLMKKQDRIMQRALNYEKIWGMTTFPLAIIGGLLVGRHYKGETLAEMFQDTQLLFIALVLIVVLVPFLSFLTNKMNQSAYGQPLENLQNNIRRMEDLV